MENTKPQITTTEIQDWEKKFKESVSPLVQFDADEQSGGNSLKLYNGQSGIEASWAGTIILNNDNYIKWSFSIQNDPFIECKLNYTKENYDILTKLFNFYATWKAEWAKQLSIPGYTDEQPAAGGEQSQQPPMQDQGMGQMPGLDQGSSQLQENERTKLNIIKNHKERMQKLSGLR